MLSRAEVFEDDITLVMSLIISLPKALGPRHDQPLTSLVTGRRLKRSALVSKYLVRTHFYENRRLV